MKHKSESVERGLRMLFALVITVQSARVVVGQSAKPRESREREQQVQTGLNLLREVVLKEADNLRLVENRAHVYKSAAAALAKRNPEESTQLLERAIGQIDAALADLRNAVAQQKYPIDDLRRVRDDLVLALSELDPTRALRAVDANKGRREPDDPRTPVDPDLESLVLQKAAATNPALVLERATKSLNTLSPGTVDTYVALRDRNPELGRQLGGAIVARLRGESPDPNSPAAQVAFALMADIWSRQQAATLDSSLLDENSIRQLVIFVADLLLAQQNPMSVGFPGDLTRFAGVLESYSPSKAGQLRNRLAKLPPQLPFGPPDMKELEVFLQAKNYDEATGWANKAPVEARQYAMYRVAQAQIENGQLDLARSFVSSHITNAGTREEVLGRLALAEAEAAAGKGDEDTTRTLISLLPSGYDRLSTLLSLARNAAENGDKEKALAILEEARALPSDKSEQLKNEMVIADAFLKIDTAKTLEIVATHIERLNALLGASAVLDGYFGPESIHDGEIRYFSPLPLFPALVNLCDVLSKIAMVDFDQALRLARRIAGPELQTLAILTIAQRLILGSDYRPSSIEATLVQSQLARSSG